MQPYNDTTGWHRPKGTGRSCPADSDRHGRGPSEGSPAVALRFRGRRLFIRQTSWDHVVVDRQRFQQILLETLLDSVDLPVCLIFTHQIWASLVSGRSLAHTFFQIWVSRSVEQRCLERPAGGGSGPLTGLGRPEQRSASEGWTKKLALLPPPQKLS